MASNPWSLAYGPSDPNPFWGPQTSAVNFCEEDYVITRYIGEFWNTVSSAVYIFYGLHGIRRSKRNNVGIFDSLNFTYWGLIGVGIFSGLYHLSLKYHTQMLDELSMHITMGAVLHATYTFQQPVKVQRQRSAMILGVLVPFFIYHCVADEFVLHVILFLGMTIMGTYKTNQIIKARIEAGPQRDKLSRLAHFGSACAALGYFIWNLDVNFCSTLTAWKHAVGMPLGIFLEFHAYWHILTGIGAYIFMAIIEFLTSKTQTGSVGVGYAWPAQSVLGTIAPKPTVDVSADKSD